jgi:hypothetical protein
VENKGSQPNGVHRKNIYKKISQLIFASNNICVKQDISKRVEQ